MVKCIWCFEVYEDTEELEDHMACLHPELNMSWPDGELAWYPADFTPNDLV